MTVFSAPPAPTPPRKRSIGLSLLWWCAGLLGAICLIIALIAGYALLIVVPQLPSLDAIVDYRPKIPLRIYTADHVLIGEFGEERRHLVRLNEIPDYLKQAVLAIEDYRFYEHGGVDLIGILRAGIMNLMKGSHAQGASTITMQVARNFFLSSEKTYMRKIYEALLAYKIETMLTKDQILELYMNQIYLGHHAYGFAAAAHMYFGKNLKNLTLAEAAMLAGLPKAPSANNPIANLKRAKARQAYILQRMAELHAITQQQYDEAISEPLYIKKSSNEFNIHAEYVAEMVRQILHAQYRDDIYTLGLNVVTTIDSGDQQAAYHALRKGLLGYERRRSYRGPEAFIKLPANLDDRDRVIAKTLLSYQGSSDIAAAVVTAVSQSEVRAERIDGSEVTLSGAGLSFAASALSPQSLSSQRIRPGAVIRLMQNSQGKWEITQLPQVTGAFISMTPQDGAIRALVGGFDFNLNKFNHVTQAWRQPGSSFKPFIYSAALDKGLGPATIINDAPLYFSSAQTGGQPWEPRNVDSKFMGPITMRTALQRSRNLVSVRILNYIRPKYAQRYITRFGFDADKHPAYLPMALGAGLVTPLQMAAGYAVFANGGYRVNPYLIAEVTDANGNIIAKAQPVVAEQSAPRVLDERNEYIMTSLLRGVAQHGTGAKSNQLGRTDLAGKTGTTNDSRDAWFAGFQHSLVAVAWMGYDQPRSLGSHETGNALALPVWIDYMRTALQRLPPYQWPMPDNVVMLNGELYYDDATPGNGFVASVGVDTILPPDQDDIAVTVDDAERRRIIELFRGP